MKKERVYTEKEFYSLVDRLIPIYKKRIPDMFDWDMILRDFKNTDYHQPDDFDSCIICSSFLGTVFQIMPSGKYWTFWAYSNMTQKEMIKDTAFSDAMEEVFFNTGMWVENGEGDPCDLFIKMCAESDDSIDDEFNYSLTKIKENANK